MDIELIQKASNEIAEYSQTEAGLAELRRRLANVSYDLTTTKGMAIAKADRAEVRTLRTSLEAKRKEIKAPALAHCRLIDDEAKRITAELLKLEEPIDLQIKTREAELEAEKAAREAAERARITAITDRIAAIRQYVELAASCRTSARVDELLGKLSRISLADFEEFADEAAAAHLDAMKRVEAILIDKHKAEQEQARIKAEQAAEAARLAAERAAFEAQQAAAKAEADRVAAQIKAQADAAAAELAAQKAAFEAEQAEFRRIQSELMQAEEAKRQAAAAAELAAAGERAALEALLIQEPDVEQATVTEQPEAACETPDEPSDGDVMFVAISAVAKEYGWTTTQATERLQAIEWIL